jgi:DGQHR domain-containing protein
MNQPNGAYKIFGRFLTQPIGEFFVGVMPASILRRIAHEDIRRLEDKSARKHIGLERPLSKDRVVEIEKYIGTVDATFPNAIIVSMKSSDIEEINKENNFLTIKVKENTATLIDGLHRLAGFNESNWNDFDLIVSVFFDLEEEDKALIFSTINLKQTKVTKSLVYDLFDLATTRSPLKTSHEIAKTLNYTNSPFFHRIKLLGNNPKWEDSEVIYKGILTQGTFVERLLKLISKDPTSDRDNIKRGLPLERFPDEIENGLVFRDFFVKNKDEAILKVMLNYFETIKETFPLAWNSKESPLSRTIGYGALMRLLTDLCKIGLSKEKPSLEREFFKIHITKAKDLEFSFDKYSPSGAGETQLYRDLYSIVIGNA